MFYKMASFRCYCEKCFKMPNDSRFWLLCLGPLIYLHKDTFTLVCISNLLIMSVPNVGYSRDPSCALNPMSKILLRIQFNSIYIHIKMTE